MKKKLLVLTFSSLLLAGAEAQAGFVIKKTAPATQVKCLETLDNQVILSTQEESPANAAATNASEESFASTSAATPVVSKAETGKKSFFARVASKLLGGKAEMSKGLYVLLAIFGLGWLAMGINDGFSGSDWLISLLLYVIMWLPGLIYTLVKMKKYYK